MKYYNYYSPGKIKGLFYSTTSRKNLANMFPRVFKRIRIGNSRNASKRLIKYVRNRLYNYSPVNRHERIQSDLGNLPKEDLEEIRRIRAGKVDKEYLMEIQRNVLPCKRKSA